MRAIVGFHGKKGFTPMNFCSLHFRPQACQEEKIEVLTYILNDKNVKPDFTQLRSDCYGIYLESLLHMKDIDEDREEYDGCNS